MADLQIFTALGILIAGCGSIIASPELKAAHWQMLTYLAWLASVTHLAGLSTVQNYLKEHTIETRIRATVMGILLLALIVAMAPSAFIHGDTRHLPARCLYQAAFFSKYFAKAQESQTDSAQLLGTILSIFFVLVNFLHRIIRITEFGTISCQYLSKKCQALINKCLSAKSFNILWVDLMWQEVFIRTGLSAFLTVRMFASFLMSMFFEVIEAMCIPVS